MRFLLFKVGREFFGCRTEFLIDNGDFLVDDKAKIDLFMDK